MRAENLGPAQTTRRLGMVLIGVAAAIQAAVIESAVDG
jgi:hypothetical protein